MSNNYKMLINGRLTDGAAKMDVINPATEEVFAKAPRGSEAQFNEAVAAAKAAFPAWSLTTLSDRRARLKRIGDIIEVNADEIARILTMEQGKPLKDATGETLGLAAFCRSVADMPFEATVLENSGERLVELHRKPLGVVAAITPWNFPLIIFGFKVPAALLAGNTLVVKPAPTTPLSTLKVASLIANELPPGVLNVVTDANDLGHILTGHADVAKVSFTGSTATGHKVMASAAQTLKRITLEMGGNDAAIVLDDVDPVQAAPGIFAGAFANSGQVCLSIKRLYVHESKHDQIVDELKKIASTAVLGDGLEQGTTHGPLQNKMQYNKVKDYLADAKSNGRIIAGGEIPNRKGYFVPPTLVVDVNENSRVVVEEQFGPILPIMKFKDLDDVIERANNSDYALGGSVWSSDPDKAKAIALRLSSGTVWVNKHIDIAPHIPQAGARKSGIGSEIGEEGLREFTQVQVLNAAV
jgi:acyl-CoA reductase-like NAD-dependent aldehyde dehydrogenase